ncbi:unnamed protein product [Durusdinium trenchii]|uniref:Secreted protein n=1 Tax=Durusdinium trenchii TaxID=1381693 RepID=A0ABP0MG48_9DINO
MLQVGVKAMLRLASSSLGPASLPTRMPLLKPFERMLLVMVASAENPKLNRTIGQTRYGSGSSPWPFPLAVYASRQVSLDGPAIVLCQMSCAAHFNLCIPLFATVSTRCH